MNLATTLTESKTYTYHCDGFDGRDWGLESLRDLRCLGCTTSMSIGAYESQNTAVYLIAFYQTIRK